MTRSPVATHGPSGAIDKATGVVATYPDIWRGRVVDVGCRSRELERALRGAGHDVEYTGVDLVDSADIVSDISLGIDRPDGFADVVVALDVLEHTDDIHAAFREVARLASTHLVVSLPNAYDVSMRWRMARGRPLSGKYGLPTTPTRDRHRWFFSFTDASAFCHARGAEAGLTVVDERPFVGPRRARAAPLVSFAPNLLAPTYLALLRRTTSSA